jgi:hypothetical protein
VHHLKYNAFITVKTQQGYTRRPVSHVLGFCYALLKMVIRLKAESWWTQQGSTDSTQMPLEDITECMFPNLPVYPYTHKYINTGAHTRIRLLCQSTSTNTPHLPSATAYKSRNILLANLSLTRSSVSLHQRILDGVSQPSYGVSSS